MIVDQLISGFVEFGGSMSLCDSKADCVGETLAQWTGGNLDAISV